MHICTFGFIWAINSQGKCEPFKRHQFDFNTRSIYMVKDTRNVLTYKRVHTAATAHKWGINAKFLPESAFQDEVGLQTAKAAFLSRDPKGMFFMFCFFVLFLFFCFLFLCLPFPGVCGKGVLNSDLHTHNKYKNTVAWKLWWIRRASGNWTLSEYHQLEEKTGKEYFV